MTGSKTCIETLEYPVGSRSYVKETFTDSVSNMEDHYFEQDKELDLTVKKPSRIDEQDDLTLENSSEEIAHLTAATSDTEFKQFDWMVQSSRENDFNLTLDIKQEEKELDLTVKKPHTDEEEKETSHIKEENDISREEKELDLTINKPLKEEGETEEIQMNEEHEMRSREQEDREEPRAGM